MSRKKTRYIAALLILGVAVSTPLVFRGHSAQGAANTDNLLAYYKLDEPSGTTATDSSGDGRDGTYGGDSGVPSPDSDVPTTSFPDTKSLHFDSSDKQLVTVAADSDLNAASSITMSVWAKVSDISAEQTFMDKYDHSGNDGSYVGLLGSQALCSTGGGVLFQDISGFSNDTWHHYVCTFSPTSINLYIDGVLAQSDTGSYDTVNSVDLSMGGQNGSGFNNSPLDGNLDDARFYNRMLGAGEITALAAGDHTTATWDGSASSDYENGANWDINAIPDPYTNIVIANAGQNPQATADVKMVDLTINTGAYFDVGPYALTQNDGGTFSNNGSLIDANAFPLNNFTNDTDSGTVVIAPVGDSTGLGTGNTYNNLIINDGLNAYWKLDEPSGSTANDSSGYINAGTYANTPTPSSDLPPVKFADAGSMEFNGSDDVVSIPDDSSLVMHDSTWAVSAWVKTTSDGGVFNTWNGSSGSGYVLQVIGGKAEFEMHDQDGSTLYSATSTASVDDGNWHLITGVRGTTNVEVYVDDDTADVGSFIFSADIINSSSPQIGTQNDNAGFFDGLIDDVRVYGHALDGTAVGTLFDGEPGTSIHTVTLANNLTVNGSLTLASGTLDVDASDYDISVAGNFNADGGIFEAQEGTVTFSGNDQSITGSTEFYDLTKSVSAAHTLTFGQGSTTTIDHTLTLNGASSQLLSLRSSTDGTEWNIDPQGTRTLDYLDVQDSTNVNGTDIDVSGLTFTDSGNNTGWVANVAPDAPISLGSAAYTMGNPTADNTPTLTFTLADDNAGDQLRYQVIIDNDSDFSSPTVDYTSALAAQGSRSFTVGQAAGSGSYATGSGGQTLADGSYYWKVQAIDDYTSPASSGYTVANSGSVAFVLDATAPSTPGTPSTTTPTTDLTPSWTWTASTDGGSGLAGTPYTVQWDDNSDFSSVTGSSTSATNSFTHSSSLSDGTWYIRVKAADTLGNESAWSSSGTVVIDIFGPTKPGTPSTTSPTNDTTPTWSWTASTDSSGLANPAYTVTWSQDNTFLTGTSTDTTNTNNYTHSTPLAPGTWYFKVSAEDALHNPPVESDPGSVSIDTTAPSTPGTPSTTTPTTNKKPAWTWSGSSDGGSGLANPAYTVQWSQSATFSSGNSTATTNTASFTHVSDLTDGTWYFHVKAADVAGNESSYSSNGSVVVDTTAPSTPGTPGGTSPTADNTPTVTWSAASDGSGTGVSSYTFEWSDQSDFSSGVNSATPGSATYTFGTLTDGTWYMRVKAKDAVNNTSSFSSTGSIVVDATAPSDPGTPSTTSPTTDTTPSWTWTASTDDGVGLATPPYTVQWSQASNFLSGVTTDTADSNTFTQPTGLADGTWYFRVKAADDLGNETGYSSNGSVIIDTTAPSVPGTPSTTSPNADNTPSWSWSASTDGGVGLANPAYSVQWSQASDFSSGNSTATTNSTSYTHGTTLADGTWYFRVKATDTLTNASAYSSAGSVLIDTTVPSTPGTPSTTSPTTDTTPSWTWAASTDGGSGLANPAYTVDWSTHNDFSSGVTSDTINTNAYTMGSPLADGTWYFRVKAADAVANESSYSSNGSVLIDNAAPSTPGTPSTTTPTTNTKPAWTWTASTDSGSGLAATPYTVQWSQSGTFSSGVSSSTSATNGFTQPSDLADGLWYFHVKAADALGNETSYSSAGSVLVDTTAPSTPGIPSTTTPTADTTPTWTWSASTDGGAGLAATPYTVDWSQASDFGSGVSSSTASGTTFTHSTPLAQGTWYFRVKAKDTLNNSSGYTSNGSVLIDTTGPSTPGTPSTTTPTNNTKPAWTWTASTDSGADLAATPYTVEWSQDNTFGTGVSSDTSATNAYTHASDLTDGTWYFRVKAADAVANESSYSSNGSVLIDTVNPSVPGTPASTASPTNVVRPAITWTASTDADSGLGNPAYQFQYCDASDFTGCGGNLVTTATNAYTYTFDLAAGRHYFRVWSIDAAGNHSAYSTSAYVDIDLTLPTTPGTPSTTTPTASTTPAWAWTASTDASGLASPAYAVQWSQDNTFGTGVSSATAASNTFTHSTGLTGGTWYFRVRATDNAGNVSSYSSNGSVFVDLTAPSVPGTPSTTSPTTDTTPAWTWTASTDGGSGLAGTPYTVQWSQSATFSSGVSSSSSATNGFTHGSPLADGTWYFRVKAADAVGNESSYSSGGSVVIDATAPATPGIPTTTSPTNNLTPTWSWTASTDGGVGLDDPAYTVEWSTDNTFGSGVSSDTSDTNSYTHLSDLADGTWYMRVKSVDLLGNVSAWSSTGSVDISTNGPTRPGQPSTTTPTTDTTPTWTWTASTAPSGLETPPYTVEWSTDNTFGTGVSSDTAATNSYTHSIALADGTWYFRVKAEDQASNFSAYSITGTVVVDTTAPSTPGTPGTTTPTADTTPSWTWTASTDGGAGLDSTPYTVEWSQASDFGSGVSSSTSATASFTHSSALTQGTWYFRVKASDSLGNTSSYSSNGTVVVDTTAPSTPGTPNTTTPTNDTTPSWTWTASTDNVALASTPYTVEWSQDNTFGTGVNSTTRNTNNFTHSTPLSEGTWYFRIKAVDSVGNESGYSSNGQVVIDTTAPTDPGTPNTPTPTSDTTPTWTWTASTDAVALAGTPYSLEWSQASDFGSGVTAGSSSTASFTHSTPLAEGTWYFRVRTTDQAGNQSGWSAGGSVGIDTTTPTTPGVPNTTTPSADNTPTWTWTASTDNDALAATPYSLQWSQDSGFSTGVSAGTSATTNFTNPTGLTDGTWYMRARAVDTAGNVSSWSAGGTVVVDATPPTTPGTPSTASPTADNTPAWTWTASTDTGVGLASPSYRLEWTQDNSWTTGVQSAVTSSTSYTHSVALADGTWYFRVEAMDQLNNAVYSSAATVVVDTTPPVVSSVAADSTSTAATITWTTNELADSKVEYGLTSSYGSQTSTTDTSPRVTSHSVDLSGFIACATYHYRVISTDNVANQVTGSDNTLTTDNCAGQAAVLAQSSAGIANADGGTASLTSSSTGVTLTVPATFSTTDAEFQIKRLDKTAALDATGTPSGYQLVGSHIYDLHALSDNDTAITSFTNPITVRFAYASADMTGLDSSTLIAERWDGSSWQALTGCTTDTTALTVTCTTTGFSTFALFAKATPAAAASSSSSSSSKSTTPNKASGSTTPTTTKSTDKAGTSSDSAGVLEDKTAKATPKPKGAIVDTAFLSITRAEAVWIAVGAGALLLLALIIHLARRGRGDRNHPHHF